LGRWGLPGWALRAIALGLLVLALAGPQLQREEREGLKNVAFLVVDRCAPGSRRCPPPPTRWSCALSSCPPKIPAKTGAPGC
jgi:hypothetical protein